jgi:hypothetical protein
MRLMHPDPAAGLLACVNQDLSDTWDYCACADLPIDEVRQRLNILPKG